LEHKHVHTNCIITAINKQMYKYQSLPKPNCNYFIDTLSILFNGRLISPLETPDTKYYKLHRNLRKQTSIWTHVEFFSIWTTCTDLKFEIISRKSKGIKYFALSSPIERFYN